MVHVEKFHSRDEGCFGRAAPAAEERERGNAPSQAGRVPAKDRGDLTSMQAPPQLTWQLQACRPGRGGGRPAQDGARPVEFRANVRAKVEGKAKLVTSPDFVDDVDDARGPVQQDAPAVPGRRLQRPVAVVLGGPLGRVADVLDVDFPGVRVPQPEEGAAFAGLAAAVNLDGVMGDRGTEVRTPLGLAVVAVGPRIGENIDAAVANLYGQRVGVGVRGDAEVPVRSPVAAAPDLGLVVSCRAQYGRARVGEMPGPLGG